MDYYTLISTLKDLTIPELKRIVKTNKDFLVLEILVFNAGGIVIPRLTNNYNKYRNIGEDGYSTILPVDCELIGEAEEILLQKLEEIK
jgi:hypothetical protein